MYVCVCMQPMRYYVSYYIFNHIYPYLQTKHLTKVPYV